MIKAIDFESSFHRLLNPSGFALTCRQRGSIHSVSFPHKTNVISFASKSYSHCVASSRRLRHDDFLEVCRTPPFFTDFSALALGLGFGTVADSTPSICDLTKRLTDSEVNRITLPEIFTLPNFPSLAHFSTVRLSTAKRDAT